MDSDPRVPTSSAHEAVVQQQPEEPPDTAQELPEDYAQWLDERRFDEEQGDL